MADSAVTRLSALPKAAGLKLNLKNLAHFNFRVMGRRVLITNAAGHFADVALADFRRLLEGKIGRGEALWNELKNKGFFRGENNEALIAQHRGRNAYLWHAPLLHIIVVSLRCNHKCLYCHASVVGQHQSELDMTLETARRTLDFIFQTPSSSLMIEFQGGEPAINWPVVEFIVGQARERSRRDGRRVILSMVSNLSLFDEDKIRYLRENRVSLCTSLDGPESLHNANRVYREGNSHGKTVEWLKTLLEPFAGGRLAPRGYDRPGALLTVTKRSLPLYREIVDCYVEMGLPVIYLRPLSPIGFARRVWDKIGYKPEEFAQFYRNAMDYILQLNERGIAISEQMSRILLDKILGARDSGFVDLRSPAGGGLGVLAYNYNGDIYASDEGRMLAQEGNERFRMGRVDQPYHEVVGHSANKEWAMASTLELQPMCAQCVYQPYCGVCPIFNTQTQDTLWGRMPDNARCKISMSLFDYLFEKLRDPSARRILESWVESKA